MAELILTDEEKKLPHWNDLDDASLGRAIKCAGFMFDKIQKSGVCDTVREDSGSTQFFNLTVKAGH